MALDISAKKVYGALKKDVSAIDVKVDNAILSMYKAGGSLEFDDLPSLSPDVANMAYLVTDAFTTTSDFAEGAGVDYPAGTYVAIVNTGTGDDPDYKYDVVPFTMVVDDTMSAVSENPLQNKVITGAVQEIKLDISNLSASKISKSETVGHVMNDGSIDENDYAEKVENATPGHLAGLDSNGNLTDSGVSPTEDVTVEGNPVTFESPFEQDAKSVVVSVKPIQDLHGYDHPWVGGAYKNKYNKDDTNNLSNKRVSTGSGGTYNSDGYTSSYLLEVAPNTAYALTIISGFNSYFCWYDENQTRISGGSWTSGNADTSPADAKYIRFDFPTEDADKVQFEQGLQATTFAPYSNICPISGIDEVEIGVSGKNLFDNSAVTLNASISTTNGTVYYTASYDLSDYIRVGGSSLIISGDNNDKSIAFGFYDADKRWFASANGYVNSPISIPNGAYYVRFDVHKNRGNIQCELGSVATAFEPYVSHTTTIPLQSTLYGGDVDVTNGDADSRYGYIASYNGETLPGAWISDRDVYTGSNSPTIGAEVAYELDTPTTISFTPTDVELLEGTNVVSTNAEKVAVTYGRSLWQDINDLKNDTEGKLDKSNVADVEGDTANRPYSVNEFMLRSDGFYKVTQPIAQNASITASNTTKTTIGANLVHTAVYTVTDVTALTWSLGSNGTKYALLNTSNVLPTGAKTVGVVACEPWSSGTGLNPSYALETSRRNIYMIEDADKTIAAGQWSVLIQYVFE